MRKLSFIILVLSLICNDITAQRDTASIESAGTVFFPDAKTGVNNDNVLIAQHRFMLNQDLPVQVSTWPQIHFPPHEIDYLKKSRRQKRTAWILLGAGSAMIITGIAGAYSADDPISSAVSFVFISGTGIVTSLISIPFFAASKRNKKRAIAASSAIGFIQKPGFAGIANGKQYPALTMKMSF